jgi:hypothetical protein
MRQLHLTAILAAVLAALAVSAETSRADDKRGDEFDRLARRLEQQARELRVELLLPFRKFPQHRALEERLQDVERQAARIHQAAERDERNRRVREALEKLDDELRGLDRLVDELGREKEIDRRLYNRVRDDMREIHDTMHRMRREL